MLPQPPERIVAFDNGSVAAHDIGRQFDHHAKIVRELIDFLKEVVRDDGIVRNGTIGPEQLSPELSETLAKGVLAQAESLLAAVKQSASLAMTAAQEARETRAAVDERLAQISKNVSQVQQTRDMTLAVARKISDAEISKTSDQSGIAGKGAETKGSALGTGVLGPNAGTFYGVDELGAAATAQDYAQVSLEWAEHMPDTIPPNILAINAITGDHWSSRWWANRSANAFGMLAWWYMGAWPSPGPPSTPNTPTGQPIPPGAMYWNTTLNSMFIWNGSTWVNNAAPQKGVTASLYYTATAGQTVFPLGTTDRHGKTFSFNQAAPEGYQAGVNGVRLEPTFDYTMDTVASTATFLRPLTLNSLVIFDLLTPASQLTPSGTVNTVLLNAITPNGVLTTFALTVAMNGHPTNVAKNEELLVSVNGIIQQPGAAYTATGASITFSTAPEADALVYIVWFGPANP